MEWDIYTVASCVSGILLLAAALSWRNLPSSTRLWQVIGGLAFIGWGAFAASQDSGLFLFSPLVFIIPFAALVLVAWGVHDREARDAWLGKTAKEDSERDSSRYDSPSPRPAGEGSGSAATSQPRPGPRPAGAGSRAWRWLRYHAVSIWAAIAIAYLLVPIALIAVFSFNDPEGKFNYTWQAFTFDHWSNIFGIEELTDALIVSLKLAALSTLIATILGTMIALALVRHNFRGRAIANVLIVIPMATPEVVIGASLLSMFLIYGASLGFGTLLIAHVMFSISFVVIVVRSRLIGFDRSLEEAARDLGASPWTTFRTVTLPLLMPGLVGAALLAFALSIDDFVISNFNSGTTETFPLWVFGAYQRGIPVEVYSIATLLFTVTVLAMVFVTWQQKRAERMAEVRADEEDAAFAALAAAGDPPGRAGIPS